MISLKKYLSASNTGSDTLARVTSLILDGVALHTITIDVAEFARYQENIRSLRQKLFENSGSPEQMLVTAGAIIHAFQLYNRDVQRQFSMEERELRDLAAMLADGLTRSCRNNQRTASQLTEIGTTLRAVGQLEDIKAVKSKIEGCLTSVQAEADRQVVEAGVTRETLQSTARKSPSFAEDRAEDPVTGLPGRRAAQTYLEKVRSSDQPHYAVVIVLERLPMVNQRFGYDAGDAYLLSASQTIAQRVQQHDQLFRWNGPVMVAVIERKESADLVRAEVRRLATARSDYTVSIGNRSILIPVPIASLAIPVWEAVDLQSLLDQIDGFVLKVIGADSR